MAQSKYLTLELAQKSAEAKRRNIDNTPTPEHIKALQELGVNIYDKVKEKFPNAYPNSVYRSKALNTAIKGAINSQHLFGEAIDIDSPTNAENLEIFKFVKDNLDFDQMIAEFVDDNGPDWCHVSYTTRRKNRKEILVASGEHTGSGATYVVFTGKEKWYK